MAKTKSLTKEVIKSWSTGTKKTVPILTPDLDKISLVFNPEFNFLDFENIEAQNFLQPALAKIYTAGQSQNPLNDLSKDDKSKLLVFALVKMAKYLAPKDNSEFLFRSLIHLAQNPVFANLLHSLLQVEFRQLKTAQFNLPELGIFMAPNKTNKYTYVLPLTPTKGLIFYLGSAPTLYSELEISDFSYGTGKRSVVFAPEHKSMAVSTVQSKQKKNVELIGNIVIAIEDPAVVMDIVKAIVMNIPQVKNSAFLSKPLEMALKFWNKK